MKVLHLITSLDPGGIEKWLLAMLTQVPRDKCVMDFCCKGPAVGKLVDLATKQGAKVFHCALTPSHVGFARNLGRILEAGRYDIVHNHLGTYSGFPVWLVHRKDVPVITSFHNTRFMPQTWTRLPGLRQVREWYSKLSIGYALRHSEYITGCSRAVLASLAPDYDRRSNFRVLYYGVELPQKPSQGEREAFRAARQWPSDASLILHVGRFIEQKNHVGLLNVFERVLTHVPQAKLVLVGDGPLRLSVQQSIIDRGLGDCVWWLGVREDVQDLMRNCDVFLFPSRFEGFGLVAIEANAASLPVVGSKIPGLIEAVRDGETAMLHDVEDVDGMARSVVKMVKDRNYAQRLGDAGRKWVEGHFSLQASAKRLLELYTECLHRIASPR